MGQIQDLINTINRIEEKQDRFMERFGDLVTRHDETLNNEKTGLVTVVDQNTKDILGMQTEDKLRKAKLMTGVTILSLIGGFGGHIAAASSKIVDKIDKFIEGM